MRKHDELTGSPKVTVITPIFNGAETVAACIQSVVTQDYPNIEHIVVDGASTDGTQDILHELGATFISEEDTGIYDAFNKGINRATGDILSILNADDMFCNETIVSHMVNFMKHNKLDFGHGKVEQVDASGNLVRLIGYDISRKQLLKKCRVAHPSVFVRRWVYEEFGLFSTGFQIAADYEFFLRVWDKVNIGFLPEVITIMRLGGISNSQIKLSYRESMAASLLHGEKPWRGFINYHYELIKSDLLQLKYKLIDGWWRNKSF